MGTRPRSDLIGSLASVVTIVNVVSPSPSNPSQCSYSPAKNHSWSSNGWIQCGWPFPIGPDHSWNPLAGTRHRLDLKAFRYAGRSWTVSARALICFAARLLSFAQKFTSPQRP